MPRREMRPTRLWERVGLRINGFNMWARRPCVGSELRLGLAREIAGLRGSAELAGLPLVASQVDRSHPAIRWTEVRCQDSASPVSPTPRRRQGRSGWNQAASERD